MAENNIVAYTEEQFKTMNPQQILDLSKDSLGTFLREARLTDPENAFKAMIMIARIGLEAETALTAKQQTLVDGNLGSFYKGPMQTIYPMLVGKVSPEEYRLLEKFRDLGQDRIGIPLLTYILCFSWCNGGPSTALRSKLEEIFNGMSLTVYKRSEPSYQEALAQWEAESKPILEQQRQEERRLRSEAHAQALAELEARRDTQIQAHTQHMETLNRQLSEAQQTMVRLGTLQFVKRYKLLQVIDDLQRAISECNRDIIRANREFEREKQELDTSLRSKYFEIHRQVEARFPVPPKPKDPNAKRSAAQIVADNYKKQILDTLERCGKLSVTQLIAKCAALAGLTPRHVRPYLMALVNEGRLKETTAPVGNEIHHFYEKVN